jgi:hypothetical protein
LFNSKITQQDVEYRLQAGDFTEDEGDEDEAPGYASNETPDPAASGSPEESLLPKS